jgi:protein SCO1/2
MASADPASPLKRLRILLWIAVVIAGAAAVAIYVAPKFRSEPVPASTSKPIPTASGFGGPFALTATDGKTVTEKTLAGRPYAIFFGFTRCPDVCPTSLARLAQLREQLGKDGMKFDIVFVSVDAGRDTPADLASYVALFKTPIIGLTGDAAQIAQVQKSFGIVVKKVPVEGGDYTVDHTAGIYLMDAKGSFVTIIDYHENDKVALEKLRRIIA